MPYILLLYNIRDLFVQKCAQAGNIGNEGEFSDRKRKFAVSFSQQIKNSSYPPKMRDMAHAKALRASCVNHLFTNVISKLTKYSCFHGFLYVFSYS